MSEVHALAPQPLTRSVKGYGALGALLLTMFLLCRLGARKQPSLDSRSWSRRGIAGCSRISCMPNLMIRKAGSMVSSLGGSLIFG